MLGLCHYCVKIVSDNLQESQSPNFDVSTAIQVCRQANYHRHALALAKKYGYHNWSVMTSDLARDIIVCFSTVCVVGIF